MLDLNHPFLLLKPSIPVVHMAAFCLLHFLHCLHCIPLTKKVPMINVLIVKFADDTVIVELLDDSDGTNGDNCYVYEIDLFVVCCRNNFLDLNVKKTKEMIIDYHVKKEIIDLSQSTVV